MPFATFSTQIQQASVAVQGVTNSINQATTGIGRSADVVRNAAVSGVTNVGTGIISAIPGVAAGIGSAAGAVAAIGTLAGNSKLTAVAGNIAVAASAVAGVASAVGAISQSVSAIARMLPGGGGGATSSGGGGGGGGGGAAGSNPLHAYASFTYLFRLSALSDGEVNSGARGMGVGVPIIDMPNGFTVGAQTYIDNVRINGVVGLDETTGNSNALNISFTVVEPYSMGKFWETLQVAADYAGHKNYNAAPYQLAIRFTGHYGHEGVSQTIPGTDKFMHLKILDLNMRVTKRGAEYDISCYPWSEGGMNKSFGEIKTDQAITCNKGGPYKVKDVLKYAEKSLKEVINKKFRDDRDRKKTVTYAHEIEICFPPPPGVDDSDGNDIGEAELGLSQFNRADSPFAQDGATYENGIYKRGEVQIDTKNGQYQFAKGSTVQDIINQIILSSDYARKALDNPGNTVKWWRIETRFHNISAEDPLTGEKAKKIIFRVVQYEVDAAKFYPPNTTTAPPPIKRDLQWYYTGKNYDILNWNIDYKVGFYKTFNHDGGANSEDKNLAQRSSNAAPVHSGGTPPEKENAGGPGPEKARRDKNQTRTANFGGASFDDAPTIAARQFHDLVNTGNDMINLELDILGDPYFLGDSGMGNFTLVDDESMEWQKGEVYIRLRFRMPEDANTSSGLYDFGGDGKPVREFSGYYRVHQCASIFNRGKFTQKLTLTKKIGVVDAGGGSFPPKEPMPDDPGIWYP